MAMNYDLSYSNHLSLHAKTQPIRCSIFFVARIS